MVEKAIQIATDVVTFAPKGCKTSDMIVVSICFIALGLLGGFFLATYIAS